MRLDTNILRVFLILALFGFSSLSFAATNITNCSTNITVPDIYRLNQSISGASVNISSAPGENNWACIWIEISNVTIDCGGFGIVGKNSSLDGTFFGISTATGLTNLTFRNCPNLYNYSYGINLNSAARSSIDNSTIHDNLYGNTQLASSNLINITRSVMTGSDYGIYLDTNSLDCILDNNTLTGNNYGINTYAGIRTNITNNLIQENNLTDLYVNGNSGDCLLKVVNNTGSGGRSINFTNTLVNWQNLEFSELILCNANGSILNNVTIRGSDTLNNNGLHILLSQDVLVNGSNSSNNYFGFDLENCYNCNITNSFVSGGVRGFQTGLSGSVTFINDTVDGADGPGFLINSPHTNLTNVTIANTKGSGAGLRVMENDTRINGVHFYNNVLDFEVSKKAGPPLLLNISNAIFDNPLGDYAGYTNLSVNDLVEADYSIDWSSDPGSLPAAYSSFAQMFVNISQSLLPTSIDFIVWSWDNIDLSGHYQSRFELWKNNESGWSMLNNTPDTAGHALSLANLASFSDFAILESTPAPPPSGGGHSPIPSNTFSISYTTLCPGSQSRFTIHDGSSPVGAATIKIIRMPEFSPVAVVTTDSEGIAYADLTSEGGYQAIVEASGYTQTTYNFKFYYCEKIPACYADKGCADTERCEQGSCVAVPCSCGTLKDRVCTPFACCNTSDCGSGMSCEDHTCRSTPPPPPQTTGCTRDSECRDTESCNNITARCEPVQGQCGRASNHTFYRYMCGIEPGCDICPLNSTCLEHICIRLNLTAPPRGGLGQSVLVLALRDEKPCAGCTLQIIDPDGKRTTVVTDPQGRTSLALAIRGEYRVSLLQGDQVARTVFVESIPPGPGGPEASPLVIYLKEAAQNLCGPLIAVGILVAIYFYIRSRKKGKEA